MVNPGNGSERQRIAVIGGGVAGIVSAFLLQKKHDITLLEKNDYLGGHTHTIEINDGPDSGTCVDTGFIVLNDATYPLFQKFLAQLKVGTRVSEMSFGFHCHASGLVYAGTDLHGLFAQKKNFINPQFYKFLFEIARFSKDARDNLNNEDLSDLTLGEYLQAGNYSRYMSENYLVPMAAAIWSTPATKIHDFPAGPFLHFFRNHGLLSFRNRPKWRTVVGGSFAYVKAFTQSFTGQIRLNTPVQAIERYHDKVSLTFADGTTEEFDQVVLATHADQAHKLLADPDPLESKLLSPWTYQRNHTVLHTDSRILPEQKHAWAAWNFTRENLSADDRPVYVTYYMNRLQGLKTKRDYCVTLNRQTPFDSEQTIAEMNYHHPLYSFDSMNTQKELPQLNGRNRTYYCGSYFGYGFHEDAVRAGNEVGKHFGVSL